MIDDGFIDDKYVYLFQKHKWFKSKGYFACYLGRRPNREFIYLHRLIWKLEYDNIPEKYEIHHINGNKVDNRLQNLECLSKSEHRKRHNNQVQLLGIESRGNNNGASKLSDEEWLHLFEIYYTNKHSQKDLAKMFGVTYAQIWNVRVGISRSHLQSKLREMRNKNEGA